VTSKMTRGRSRAENYFSDGSYNEIVFMTTPCGFCMTKAHESCKAELSWNNKLYLCGCKTCDVHSRYEKKKEEVDDEEHN